MPIIQPLSIILHLHFLVFFIKKLQTSTNPNLVVFDKSAVDMDTMT
jgi:hypothetical protein